MASSLAVFDTGYDDGRFEQIVSQTLHCIICTNVIKDPVACGHNEHLFCRACITEHLKNHQTCPSCMDPLTVDTLSQASRSIRNLLNELKIRCEFFDRGCGKFIELGNLEGHIKECGFAPAVCSNEGCELEVNKQDLLHHETTVCEQRRVKCHSCNDIRQEMDMVKINLATMNVKLNEMEMNGKAVEDKLVTKVELVQEHLNKQEESNRRFEEEMKSLKEITEKLESLAQETLHEIQAEKEYMKKGIAEAVEMDREPKVVIAGGKNKGGILNSVEFFSMSNGTWTRLQPMKKSRKGASSVVYNNQFIVTGGFVKSMEKLSWSAVQTDQSITWDHFAAQLPGRLRGHCSVVCNGRLIVTGGFDADRKAYCDSVTEISLGSPHTSKLLATMRKPKCHHGVVLFGNVMIIFGGREGSRIGSALRAVVMYDITTNEFKELAPLPYPVYEMATVKWGDDNVMILGGAESKRKPLDTVLIYNIKTQKSYMLPNMQCKRKGCVGAVVRDTVIVMGGKDESGSYLKSVESFRFERYTWEKLPEMHEIRYKATAVVR